MCQRYRMEHRPCRGRPQALDRFPPHLRENPQRIHVGMLPLARSHADGGEALEQLAAVETFLTGVLQVIHLEVLIEVDEFFAAGMRENRIRMCRALGMRYRYPARDLPAEAYMAGRTCSGITTVRDALRERIDTIYLATSIDAAWQG